MSENKKQSFRLRSGESGVRRSNSKQFVYAFIDVRHGKVFLCSRTFSFFKQDRYSTCSARSYKRQLARSISFYVHPKSICTFLVTFFRKSLFWTCTEFTVFKPIKPILLAHFSPDLVNILWYQQHFFHQE